MSNNIAIYLVFGPQGSGKSTQAELLSQRLSAPYFNAGNELRRYIETDSAEATLARSQMQNGQLVGNDLLRRLFIKFIDEHNCEMGVVADGFPRNISQIEILNEQVERYNWNVIGLYIDIPDDVAKERLSKRYTVVNGQKIIRFDDQPAIVEKRLRVFKRETLPVLDYLKANYTLRRIDGRPPIRTVQNRILKAVNG